MESPGGYVTIDFSATMFAWILCTVGPPSRALVTLNHQVEVNSKNGINTDGRKQEGKVFYRQEPFSGESITTECGVNYQLLAVIYRSSKMGNYLPGIC